jgi:hypothetical protein
MMLARSKIGPDALLAKAIRHGLEPREIPPLPASSAGPEAPTRGPELDADLKALVDSCNRSRMDALQLARTGELAAAVALVEDARARSLAADLPSPVRLRDEAHHAGAASYLAYRAGDHRRAEAILEEGCAADAEAFARFGDRGALTHALRLRLNLVRVRWRAGDIPGATEVATSVLDAIAVDDGRTSGLAFFELLTVEQIAEIVIDAGPPDRQAVAAVVRIHLDGPGRARADRGHDYLRAVVAVEGADVDGAAAALAALFERGPSGSRLVWRAGLRLVDLLIAAGLLVPDGDLELELARAAASRRPSWPSTAVPSP